MAFFKDQEGKLRREKKVEDELNVIFWNSLSNLTKKVIINSEDKFLIDEKDVEEFLINPLKKYILNNLDSQNILQNLEKDPKTPIDLNSKPKSFNLGDPVFQCQECNDNFSQNMCENCFIFYQHSRHNFIPKDYQPVGSYRKHTTFPDCFYKEKCVDGIKIQSDKVENLKFVLNYLIRYIMRVASGTVIGCRPLPFVDNKSSDNTHCLIALIDSYQENFLEELFDFLGFDSSTKKQLLNVGKFSGLIILCTKGINDCKDLKKLIKNQDKDFNKKGGIIFKVVKMDVLAHLGISISILKTINEIFRRTPKLVKMLTNLVFKHLEIDSWCFENEFQIWRPLRHSMIENLIEVGFLSEHGRKLISNFFARNSAKISERIFLYDTSNKYIPLLEKNLMKYSTTLKYIFTSNYLVVKINLVNSCLKNLKIAKLLKNQCTISNSKKFKNLVSATRILYKFIKYFSDYEYSNKMVNNVYTWALLFSEACRTIDSINFMTMAAVKCACSDECAYTRFIELIQKTSTNLVNILIKYPDSVDGVIEKFSEFYTKRLFLIINPKTIPTELAIEDMFVLNEYTRDVTLISFYRRFFMELVLISLEDNRTSSDLILEILKNETLMLWISIPIIRSINKRISLEKNDQTHFDSISHFERLVIFSYYLRVCDFKWLQVLMANLSPGLFINLVFTNTFMDKSKDYFDLYDDVKFQTFDNGESFEMLRLIFNACVDRIFAGTISETNNIIYQFMIQILKNKPMTIKEIQDNKLFGLLKNLGLHDSETKLSDQLYKCCNYDPNSLVDVRRFKLRTEHIRKVNRIYYLYTRNDIKEYFLCAGSNGLFPYDNFDLPDIPKLRSEFDAIHEFVLSEEFLQLIILFFQKFKFRDFKNPEVVMEYEIILMCACFIFQTILLSANVITPQDVSFCLDNHDLINSTLFDYLKDQLNRINDDSTVKIILFCIELIQEIQAKFGKNKSQIIYGSREEFLIGGENSSSDYSFSPYSDRDSNISDCDSFYIGD